MFVCLHVHRDQKVGSQDYNNKTVGLLYKKKRNKNNTLILKDFCRSNKKSDIRKFEKKMCVKDIQKNIIKSRWGTCTQIGKGKSVCCCFLDYCFSLILVLFFYNVI